MLFAACQPLIEGENCGSELNTSSKERADSFAEGSLVLKEPRTEKTVAGRNPVLHYRSVKQGLGILRVEVEKESPETQVLKIMWKCDNLG